MKGQKRRIYKRMLKQIRPMRRNFKANTGRPPAASSQNTRRRRGEDGKMRSCDGRK